MKTISTILIASMCLLGACRTGTARVEQIGISSASMNKTIPATVILPASYNNSREAYPVLYLLHGHGGTHRQYISGIPGFAGFADKYNIIIVCPDGQQSSWFFDSTLNPAWKYETHISQEVVDHIDNHYRTIKDRNGRAISGLSMGGHGALFIAARHRKIFGAAGSMMGCADITRFPERWNIRNMLGDYSKSAKTWESHSVISNIVQLRDKQTALLIDCGIRDIFISVNRALHRKLIEKNISHVYIERPGGHTFQYIYQAIEYQFLFFRKYFDNKKGARHVRKDQK